MLSRTSVTICGVLLLAHGSAFGQSFAYSLAAPGSVSGEAGEFVEFDVDCRLTSTGLSTAGGAEGWSIGVVAEGAAIVGATTAGTAGDIPPAGVRHAEESFELTELTGGDGNAGAVSTVVLSLEPGLISLPPSGTQTILRLRVRAPVPEPVGPPGFLACAPTQVGIEFRDGLRGSGDGIDNEVTYGGAPFRPSLEAVVTEVCPILPPAQFVLSLDGPAEVSGAEGADAVYRVSCDLMSASIDSADGAEGWSVSLAVEGGSIAAASTLGTAGDVAPAGFRHPDVSFEYTELTAGPGNEGATSVVLLSLGVESVTLPPAGSVEILRLEIASPVPDAVIGTGGEGAPDVACEPAVCRISYIDGRRGSAQPVENKVSYRGFPYRPSLGEPLSTSICPVLPTPSTYRVDVLSPRSERLDLSDGSYPWYVPVHTSLDARKLRLGVVLESHLPEGAPGVEAWSYSLLTPDCFEIDGFTTARTAADLVPRGFRESDGFERTEIVDPALNGGRRGLVSAVQLCESCDTVLPPDGVQRVLEITGFLDAAAIGSIGEEAPPCILELTPSSDPGLRGSGDPVRTAAVVAGVTEAAVVRSSSLILVGAPQVVFKRAETNNDFALNIADPVWLLNFLFRSGEPLFCEKAANANGDLSIDISDAIFTLSFLFNAGGPPPAPFPGCGVALIEDPFSCDTPSEECES